MSPKLPPLLKAKKTNCDVVLRGGRLIKIKGLREGGLDLNNDTIKGF